MESITLQTNDSIISSGDSIGQLQFAASNESDGSASRYVIGKIYAQGEGAFNASSNPASIVFATSAADSLPASGKLKISHEGHVIPLEDNTYDLGSSSQRFRHLYVADTVYSPTGELSYLYFDTTVGDVDQVAGQLNWNSEAGTIDLGLTDDLTIHLGQSVLFRVKNSTGSTITKGEAVYASGVLGGGQVIQVAPFAADETVPEVRFIGLMADDLANGEDGYVNHFGHIKNVDLRTSNTALNPNAETWAIGDILFVDDTVPGGLTKVQPKDDIYVALVLADGQNGELFVRITDPGHINDLHDVNTSGVSNGQYLKYDSNSEVWKPGDPWKTLTPSDFTEVIGSGYYFQAENNGRYVLPYAGIVPLLPYEIIDPSGESGANYSLFIQNGWYYKIGGTTYDANELNKKIIHREYRASLLGGGGAWYSTEFTNHEHTVSQITDINTSGVADNNFLVWNSGNETWEPSTTLTFDGTTLHTDTDGISAIFGRNNSLTSGGKVRILVDDNDTASSVQAIKAFNNKTTGTNFGINATANGSGATKNVGLYGWADQATTNWGLWVNRGYTILEDRVGIKTTVPTYDLHVNGSGNITGDMIVGGNLTIQGNTVTANVSTMEIEDPIFTLGLASGTIVTDTNLDRGLALALNNDVMAFMGWDVSESEFSLLSSGVASNGSGNYAPGTYGDLHIGALTATAANFSSTIDAANLGAGEDNSVVILDSDGKLRTDEIDSRVWGSSLVDGAGSANHIAYWTDTNTLSYDNSQLYWDSTNDRLGIGKASPGVTLDVKGDAIKINSDGSDYVSFDMNIYEGSGFVARSANAFFSLYKGSNIGPTVFDLIIDGNDNTDSLNSAISIRKSPGFYDGGSADFNVNINKTAGYYVFDVGGTGNFDGDIRASGNIVAPNIGADTDNSVVILNSAGLLKTDEIDSRVWGSSLVDGAGTTNYVSKWTDSNTLGTGIIYDNGTRVGIATTAPSGTLHVVGEAHVDNLKLDGNTLSATNTNGNIIINPNGNGALQADSGGDARGAYAVDLQRLRVAATQVASGACSVISGGKFNTASGPYNTISGGRFNCASTEAATVGGGDNNCATAFWTTIAGGVNNKACCYGATVGGGFGNTSSSWYSTVSGGYCNTASGYCSTVSGGYRNCASGNYSTIAGGRSNTLSGTYSFAVGKSNNDAGCSNVYILGSNITATQANTTYTENIISSGNATISGHLAASTKSFLINHPTRPGHKLQYGSLESPYHGIRLTGRGKIQSGWCVIKLPEYICELVRDNEDINIQITNYKHSQVLYVSDIDIANNEFTIKTNSWFTRNNLEFFWTFTAVREDVEPLKVEF